MWVIESFTGCVRTDCLVVPRDRAIPPEGSSDTLFNHCVRIARACRERGGKAPNAVQRMSFNNLEQKWLQLGQSAGADRQAVLVGATVRPHPSLQSKLSA
jgi:hypothetical protein